MTQTPSFNDLLPSVPDAPCPPDAPTPEQTDSAPETDKEAALDSEELLRLKYVPIPYHPLAPLNGAFNDDPLWDEFWQNVLDYRQKQNEQSV